MIVDTVHILFDNLKYGYIVAAIALIVAALLVFKKGSKTLKRNFTLINILGIILATVFTAILISYNNTTAKDASLRNTIFSYEDSVFYYDGETSDYILIQEVFRDESKKFYAIPKRDAEITAAARIVSNLNLYAKEGEKTPREMLNEAKGVGESNVELHRDYKIVKGIRQIKSNPLDMGTSAIYIADIAIVSNAIICSIIAFSMSKAKK